MEQQATLTPSTKTSYTVLQDFYQELQAATKKRDLRKLSTLTALSLVLVCEELRACSAISSRVAEELVGIYVAILPALEAAPGGKQQAETCLAALKSIGVKPVIVS